MKELSFQPRVRGAQLHTWGRPFISQKKKKRQKEWVSHWSVGYLFLVTWKGTYIILYNERLICKSTEPQNRSL